MPTGGQLSFYVGMLFGGLFLAGYSIAGALTGAASLPAAGLGLVLSALWIIWALARLREYNRS